MPPYRIREERTVPCNGCKRCCYADTLILHPEEGDDYRQYLVDEVRHPITGKIVHALQHKEDGSCVYLGENGCTIHERAPAICRFFDCRLMYWTSTRPHRRRMEKLGYLEHAVHEEGRKRVDTLTEEDKRRFPKGSVSDINFSRFKK